MLCMCSFVVKWIFGCVVKMTDNMKHRWLRIDYEYTKRSYWNEEITHNCRNFCSVLLVNVSLFRLTKFWNFQHKPMNDICGTDFVRINLKKMIVATAVKIVLTLATSKIEKNVIGLHWRYFRIFYFFICNEKWNCHTAFIVCSLFYFLNSIFLWAWISQNFFD